MDIERRTASTGLAATAAAAARGRQAAAQQDITFFRIGTGSTTGTYFPVAGLIGHAISNPPGSRPCDDGGGVPGLIATAVATQGSAATVAGIATGRMQSGFVQSDVAYWAHTGSGLYAGQPQVEVLRAIANL